jgi:hypothetical protein
MDYRGEVMPVLSCRGCVRVARVNDAVPLELARLRRGSTVARIALRRAIVLGLSPWHRRAMLPHDQHRPPLNSVCSPVASGTPGRGLARRNRCITTWLTSLGS